MISPQKKKPVVKGQPTKPFLALDAFLNEGLQGWYNISVPGLEW
jgi:hypothetical protein